MADLLKPKILGDVTPSDRESYHWSVFENTPERINLSKRRFLNFDFIKPLKVLIFSTAFVFFLFGSANAPSIFTTASGDNTTSTTSSVSEQQQLQAQLKQLEQQINQYENQITSYRKQGNTLSNQIAELNANIAKINLQIKATTLTLQELDQNIASTQTQISVTQADIITKKAALANMLNDIYQTDQVSFIEVLLKNPRLSDFWDNVQNLNLLQSNLRVATQQVVDLVGTLQNQEQQFAASKTDVTSIQDYQQAQKTQIASTQAQKSTILAETKGQESKYQVLLTKTQETAAQIRARIFQLLGGGQLSFESAYQYAKMASNATGIDPSMLLAVLDRESALGQNVGKCSYSTAMSPSNQPIFLEIAKSLNLDPNILSVSCPNSDGVYGGAMGPAQFVPSTWMLYSSGISKITGNNPASPWNDADAFVATALYLKDAMVGCAAIYSSSISQNRCVAAKYYAGSRWKNYLWTYGEAVVDRAQSFANDIATITNGN